MAEPSDESLSGGWPLEEDEDAPPRERARPLEDASELRRAAQRGREAKHLRDKSKQRWWWHWGLLISLMAQLAVVHVLFWIFLSRNGFDANIIDYRIWIAYLSTTLGETVGLAYVVVKHLFPDES